MQIHPLNCGTFCPLGQRAMNGYGSPVARGKLICLCLLLETRDGLVLIDTGLGRPDVRDPGPTLPGSMWQMVNQAQLQMEETAIHQVRHLGFDPKGVRHIVLTHLDFDHAGGLGDFPKADIHVHATEQKAALARDTMRERMRYAPRQFVHGPNWLLHQEGGDRWMGFRSVKALTAGETDILLIPLFGHSRGHCGIAIRTANGWLLHAGDAIFHRHELRTPRECPPGLRAYQNVFQYDRGARMENQERLRELAARESSVRILCSHDPDQSLDSLAPSAETPTELRRAV